MIDSVPMRKDEDSTYTSVNASSGSRHLLINGARACPSLHKDSSSFEHYLQFSGLNMRIELHFLSYSYVAW
jgi:hypothetical protein